MRVVTNYSINYVVQNSNNYVVQIVIKIGRANESRELNERTRSKFNEK